MIPGLRFLMMRSPEGMTVNSPGREPWGQEPFPNLKAPKGRQKYCVPITVAPSGLWDDDPSNPGAHAPGY